MRTKWTEAQQAVIDARGGSLLVAAAAGSGKTAVLVEHILSRLSDPERPVDVDRLLIVTFTKAAAAEMRERLTRAIESAVEAGHSQLERQLSLLPHAHISTIDSFCMWVVKNHFPLLGLDPDFRIGEEGELKLLRTDVLSALLEEQYQKRNPAFLALADAYAGGKTDAALEGLVLQLYGFAQSAPYPYQWLEECRHGFGEDPETGDVWESLDRFPWAGELLLENKRRLRSLREQLDRALEEVRREPVVAAYGPMFLADRDLLDSLLLPEELCDWLQVLSQVKFTRKPSKRGMEEARELQERLSALRDFVKEEVTRMQKRCCLGTPEEMLSGIRRLSAPMQALIQLTEDFSSAFEAAKRKKNLAEFSDVAHWALKLLDGPTELAFSLGREFEEIAVDEYQDSNLIQERILTAISGIHRGEPNLFLVGDVKQSIYKFRRARPELFLEKYNTYSYQEDAKERKIDLNRNFRTRPGILDLINHVFYQLMGEELGGVAYTPEAALYPGASYPPDTEPVELLYAQCQGEEEREWEARVIGQRIRELTAPGGMQVWDGAKGEFRPLQYRDMVILLRTTEGWAESFAAQLNQMGIPAVSQEKRGYFSAPEVQVVLSLLQVLDNPRQDIPLAAVLLSPFAGFSEEELAGIPGQEDGVQQLGEDGSLYSRCCRWNAEKMQAFLEQLENYRQLAACLPIHELLDRLLTDSAYSLYLSALPGGEGRRANIEMLREKAMEFENTSLHGLFQFNRYMEKAQKYQVDYGPASTLSDQEDLVRITSIHKSKGLEYPVVFVAGLSKTFNLQDARKRVIFHEDGGIASDVIDTEQMVKTPCLWKQVLADRMVREVKGEELRILYVALTRAREKLILTAAGKGLEEARAKAAMAENFPEQLLPGWLVEDGNSYLDWILMALVRDQHGVVFRTFTSQELVEEEVERQGRNQWLRTAIPAGWVTCGDPDREALWERRLAYRYPALAATRIPSAYSVSQLKHAQLEAGSQKEAFRKDSSQGLAAGSVPAEERRERPEQTADPAAGARQGTLYHRVLERLSPEEGTDLETVNRTVREEAAAMEMDPEEGVCGISPGIPEAVAKFYRSPLGRRVQEAHRRGLRQTEHPFVMGVPASRILGPEAGEELVLVQGIIDLFWEEADGLVLVDYKTDRVSAETLLKRYRGQLIYYREALARAVGKPVKETWIYSFHLGEAVPVA